MRTCFISSAAAALALAAFSASAAPSAAPKAVQFPLDRVRVTGGVFKHKQDIDREYLLEYLDKGRTDRLLAEFRRVAGLPEKAKRYSGRWEGGGINGHSLGHYLTALAACYAATGDARAKERVDYIVDELAECQRANGDGYVMTIPQAAVWDKVRRGEFAAGGFDICGWWVPNYTIHKVFAGLRDAYRWTGSRKALEVERGLGDWYCRMIEGLSDEQMQKLMRSEWGGLNETFADLAHDTGDAKFLAVAKDRFNHREIFDPLRRGEDRLDGKHANTQMPKITGLATIYEMTGDAAQRRAVETYWRAVVDDRSFANGGHSDHEHFYPVRDTARHLGPQTAETCNINNMHRLSAHVFSWAADDVASTGSSAISPAHVMDFVERSLLNQIVANIGEKPGEFGYFMSTRPVATKVFSTPEGAWWCCVGTGMENPMRYGEQTYFHDEENLWVNLFMPSTLDWREKGVKLEQVTDFPEGDTVTICVAAKRPVRFALRIRKPYWCERPEFVVTPAAKDTEACDGMLGEDGYLVVDRVWKGGEKVRVRMPMTDRIEPLHHAEDKFAAFMHGPLLMVGITPPEKGVPDPAKKRWDDHLAAPAGTMERAMTLVDGKLQPHDVPMMPYYKVYEEHYTMYFPVMGAEEWKTQQARLEREQAEREELAKRTVDSVEPGFQQSEVNHDYSGEHSEAGDFRNRKYRHAQGAAGSFGYTLAVDPKAEMELVATYFGGDAGRTFDVFVDGKLLKRETLPFNGDARRDFADVVYPLPRELTKGRKSVRVEFRGNERTFYVGGLFGLSARRRAQK